MTIRDGTAEGEHIIEVRTRVHAESFFEDACPCPDEIPVNLCLHLICSAAGIGDSPESVVADCLCAALCSGDDDDSAPSAGAVSVDGFTTWVISTKDISWIETGEEKITASLQSRKGPCSCFAACFTNSGGNDDDDDDESSCCKCCEYEFNDVTKSLKSKSMTIHTNVGTSIPINWDAQNTAIASEKLDCCNPSIQRKSTEEIDYGKFNDNDSFPIFMSFRPLSPADSLACRFHQPSTLICIYILIQTLRHPLSPISYP